MKGSGKVDLELVDTQGKQVATATANKSGLVTMNVENPKKWSAETPYLYTLRASMQGSNEVIPVKVGFRKIELKGDQILVNGKAVLFKGADRHEMDPDGGYVVSPERMLQDIQIMKQFNLNDVRNCHYTDDNLWYDLCDQYGIYAVSYTHLSVCSNPRSDGKRIGTYRYIMYLYICNHYRRISSILNNFIRIKAVQSTESSEDKFPIRPLEARIPVKHVVLQTIIYRVSMYFRCSTIQRYINMIHFCIGGKP